MNSGIKLSSIKWFHLQFLSCLLVAENNNISTKYELTDVEPYSLVSTQVGMVELSTNQISEYDGAMQWILSESSWWI